MKRIISLILTVVLALSLCACGGSGGGTDQGLQVGFDRQSVTPTETGAPIAGGDSSARPSDGFLDEVSVTCIALSKGGETYLVFTCDYMVIYDKVLDPVKTVISGETGVPKENMLFNCTHTHSGVDINSSKWDGVGAYRELFSKRSLKAAQNAIEDLSAATISYGSTQTEGLAFVRHYRMNDGSTHGNGHGSSASGYKAHMYEADQELQLIKFTREAEDKKDIIIASFPAHATTVNSTNPTSLSADYPGAFREAMELQRDCYFSFFQGAAGNNNSKTRLQKESRTTDTAEYGALLAGYASDCLENNMTKVEDPGLLQSRYTVLEAEVNHDTDGLYYAAKEVQAVWVATNTFADAKAVGMPYGIRSPYMANAITNRYNRGATETSELNAIAIGNHVAFVSAPNELYDQLGEMTEASSTYPMTVTLGYTNGYTGYIPTAYGFEYTSYESDVCWFKPGIGEIMVDTFLSMLDEMDG